MGNRISDIEAMRSQIGVENRGRRFGAPMPGRLGTANNPAVVSLQSDARFKEVTAIFEEHGWKYRIVLEPGKPENISDLNRLLNPPRPKIADKKVGRNEPCLCGSGKKFKNCRDH